MQRTIRKQLQRPKLLSVCSSSLLIREVPPKLIFQAFKKTPIHLRINWENHQPFNSLFKEISALKVSSTTYVIKTIMFKVKESDTRLVSTLNIVFWQRKLFPALLHHSSCKKVARTTFLPSSVIPGKSTIGSM
jgi:hypothetical protein